MINPTPTLTNMSSGQRGDSVASLYTAGTMVNMARPIPSQAENLIRLYSSDDDAPIGIKLSSRFVELPASSRMKAVRLVLSQPIQVAG